MASTFMLDLFHLVGQKGKNVWEVLVRETHHPTPCSNGWDSVTWVHLFVSECSLPVFPEGKGNWLW